MLILNLQECDGGIGDGGTGSGIAYDSVLGPTGGIENGDGVMGPNDFYIPFPVMPVLYRYKTTKSKKQKQPKNPYVGKIKIIKESDISTIYTDDALKEFNNIISNTDPIFCNVLYSNDSYKLIWRIIEDGTLEMFKPIEYNNNWYIYHTKLTNDDTIVLLDKNGPYSSINDAYNYIWKTYKDHQKKLNEMLKQI